MSFDSQLQERAQAVANRGEKFKFRAEWRNDQFIEPESGRILAMIELQSGYCNVLMNGEVRAQFVDSAKAKRWVEGQNL